MEINGLQWFVNRWPFQTDGHNELIRLCDLAMNRNAVKCTRSTRFHGPSICVQYYVGCISCMQHLKRDASCGIFARMSCTNMQALSMIPPENYIRSYHAAVFAAAKLHILFVCEWLTECAQCFVSKRLHLHICTMNVYEIPRVFRMAKRFCVHEPPTLGVCINNVWRCSE